MFTPLGNFIYRFVTASLKMPVFSLIREFEYAEKMSKEWLEKYQWDKLHALIKHAILYSPYYRKVFSELGAEPEDIKDEASLRKIPVLTKDIISERGNEILVRPRPWLLTRVMTSGSTGKPLKFYKDPAGRASTYAAMYRGHRW
jgi:phenylacetate-CoA ligase